MASIEISVQDNARTLHASNASWSSARDGVGKYINTYWEAPNGFIQCGSWLSGGVHHVQKAMLRFPLTDPAISGASINSAKLYFYPHTSGGAKSSSMQVTEGFQSIPVVIGDWDNNLTQTGVLGSRSCTITLDTWNYITLDVAGVNYILANIGGAVKFCIRSHADYYNTNPVAVYDQQWNTYGTENANDFEWYLELDYISAGTRRVSGIRHIYRPGSYRAELTLGDVSATSEVVRSRVILPPPYEQPYMDKLKAEETEAARTVTLPEKTIPELIRAIEEDVFPASAKVTMPEPFRGLVTPSPISPTGDELAAKAEQYLQAAGAPPSYPQERNLWERITPWDERKGETFGGEIRERVDALRSWFKDKAGWLSEHLGGGMN